MLSSIRAGNNKNRLFVDLYKNYSDYTKVIEYIKSLPFIDVESIDSFLVDLKDRINLRILSISSIAKQSTEDSQNKSE